MKKLVNLTAITILSTTTISHLTKTNFKGNNNKAKNNSFQKNASATKTKIIKSDQQLFNEVKNHLKSFDDKKPFELKGINDNSTIEDILNKVKDNLKATFEDDATRIKSLTMANLNKILGNEILYGIFYKNITFSIGSTTILFDEIKIAFNIKLDKQLFDEVKNHLKSFTADKPFKIKGLGDNNTIEDVLNKINDNLKATFGDDATRIKSLTMANLDSTINENGLFDIFYKNITFSIGSITILFDEIKINIKPDQQLFTEVKNHFKSFNATNPLAFALKGLNENNTIEDVLNQVKANLETEFGEDFSRIKNLTMSNLNKTINDSGLLEVNNNWKNIEFNVGLYTTTNVDDIVIYFDFKSDTQLFNEVKNHLKSFDDKKPFKLKGINDNSTLEDILNKVKANLQAEFDASFKRIKNLKIINLDKTIRNDGLLNSSIFYKNITFNIGTNKTSLNDIKIAFNIKSDTQLFNDVKAHLKSFDANNPFDLKGLSDNNTIRSVLKKIKANLEAKFGEDATRIKNLTMSNLNETIKDDKLLNHEEGMNCKYITFNVGNNTTLLDDVKITFNIKSNQQLFDEVKKYLASFTIKKPFALKGLSENNTIADVLKQIKVNLQATFANDIIRIQNLKIPNLNKTIKEDGLLNSVINWKYIAFSVGLNTTSFGNIKIYFKINSDWQLFNDVKSHLTSFNDKKPFKLKGLNDNNRVRDVLNQVNANLETEFGNDFKRIKNLTMDNLDNTISDSGLNHEKGIFLKCITFNVEHHTVLLDDVKVTFNIKSDQQLFNEVKKYLANFDDKKPFELKGISENNTIEDILKQINDNLKTTFKDDFTRIKNLTMANLNKTISDSGLYATKWKNITFNIGTNKTSPYDIKITFNIKSDKQLFDEVTKYLASFKVDKPFDLTGFGNTTTIEDVVNQIKTNLQAEFGEYFSRIKSFRIPNINTKISKDELFYYPNNWKYIIFDIGNHISSLYDIKIYFKSKSDQKLFNDVKSYLQSFDNKKPFELKGLNENNTIEDVLNKIKANLEVTFNKDFKRIKNLTIANLNKTIKEDRLLEANNNWKNITFNIGTNKTLTYDIKITFNIKLDKQLFDEVTKYLANFDDKNPFKLTRFSENNTITDVLNQIKANLETEFGNDFSRIEYTIHNIQVENRLKKGFIAHIIIKVGTCQTPIIPNKINGIRMMFEINLLSPKTNINWYLFLGQPLK